jgi:lipopolysaccharide transport system ATP-binding protein
MQGKTVVLVSHDLGTISALCDRAIFLDRGAIAAIGEPDEVIDVYLPDHPVVAV